MRPRRSHESGSFFDVDRNQRKFMADNIERRNENVI